jgi:hypothetical protein
MFEAERANASDGALRQRITEGIRPGLDRRLGLHARNKQENGEQR